MSFKILGKDSLREKLLCGFAVAMFSVVIFAYFFAQNTSEVTPHTAAILASFIFIFSILSYIPSLIIFRRAFPAMVFCVIAWLGFHLSPLFYKILADNWPWWRGITIAITSCIIIIAFLVTITTRKIRETIRITLLFICVLAVILFMNLGTLLDVALNGNIESNSKIQIKKNFIVDSNSKSPNIYWIHPDGMLGVDAVKKYFGEDQKEFLAELKERGFEINPSANFEARHLTAIAVPVLMNPCAYDNWLHNEILLALNSKHKDDYQYQFLRTHNEFQYALAAKNYAINIIAPLYVYYPVHGGQIWLTNLDSIFSYEDINSNWVIDALNFSNPYIQQFIKFILSRSNFKGKNYQVKIPKEKLEKIFMKGYDATAPIGFAGGLYDTLYGNYSIPKLTIIHDVTVHYPFIHSENGSLIHKSDNINPLDYYSQHVYAGKVLISIIDMILGKDPEAVIVIQADHGLHANTEEELKAVFGNDTDPREIWNSTMSALRVPPEYKTGEEHYALETPLNMTRYLVNSFVGKNYEYLKE